ncbi:MAG: fimbrial biosis outer rane usher protein [Proteobacteria bacterium]|nr:fimbrial biosis outer rane usher protein [Pseudomonadota bacterium]
MKQSVTLSVPRQYMLSPVAMYIAMVLMIPVDAQADLYFAPELLASDTQTVADLSRFEKEGAQLPGYYYVDIYINDKLTLSRNLQFIVASDADNNNSHSNDNGHADAATAASDIHDNTGLMACLTRQNLEDFGVNLSLFPQLSAEKEEACISPGKYIPDAYTTFDFLRMRLDISVPQAAMQNRARGYIPVERWDEGVNAALLNYSFNGSNSHGRYGDSSSHYLNLNSGFNIGAWRLRDYRTWNQSESNYYSYSRWQHIKTYAGRAIIPLRSDLVMGDSTTNSDVFDSLGFRGMQIGTDDSMYPDSRRGFAPVIRGEARSNAKVSIEQNGYKIYQTFVSPGAFTIDDLYPVYSSGDLKVIITEADGSIRIFTVPYSSVPVLQREGNIKYTLAAGRFNATSDSYESPEFAQATLIWGLPHNVTAYGGMQYSQNYLAGLVGTGFNLGLLGAFSADITRADSTLADGSRHQGQSLRFLYSRSLNSLGSTFQLMGYRYSSRGFYSLEETALKDMSGRFDKQEMVDQEGKPIIPQSTDYYNLYTNKRSKIQASISQRVGELGSAYLSGIRQTYWNRSGSSDSLQAGFNGSLGKVNYGLSWSYNRGGELGTTERSLYLSLSVPLDLLSGGRNRHQMYATYSANQDNNGSITQQAGLSGTALAADNLGWNITQGYSRSSGNSGNLSANYRGAYGSTSAGYSYSDSYKQVNYGLNGGALLHADGLTLGQQLGETSVLIAAPGVSDVVVDSEPGIRTDSRGYAIKPYASAYRENRVALDVASLNDQTELDEAVSRVVPTRGAVVLAPFKGRTGSRVIITLTYKGKPLPFGTSVTADESGGIVGDDGQVYLSGMAAQGTLRAFWGTEAGKQCTARWQLPAEASEQSVLKVNSVCS